LSLADRSLDDEAIGRLWTLLHLVCIASASGDLQASVDTIQRLADDALGADIERV
jgi:hypothetical protein